LEAGKGGLQVVNDLNTHTRTMHIHVWLTEL
jgi:hypothetical protein